MKMTSDDPRLTAYALGELKEAECATVEAALANQPELAAELMEVSGLSSLLKETLGGAPLTLGEERHQEIYQAGKRPDGKILVLENRKKLRRQSLFAVAGVAAVVTLGFYLLSLSTVKSPGSLADSGEGAEDSQVAGVAGGPNSTGTESEESSQGGAGVSEFDLPQPISVKEVSVTELTALRLSLGISRADLIGYERALASGRAVKLRAEEWVNVGEHSFEPDVSVAGVSVSAELGACPWDGEKNLLLVMLRDLKADGVAPQIAGNLLLESGRVKTARLVASSDVAGEVTRVQEMRADSSVALLYELELIPGEGRVASIDLEVMTGHRSDSSYLPILDVAEEASVNYETAVTLAQFVKWQNSVAQDDTELIAITERARSLLGKVSEADRRYALDLILLTADSKR